MDASAEVLLGRLNRELELLSSQQHRLARRVTAVRELATRLRTGEAVARIQAELRWLAEAERERDEIDEESRR